MKFPFVSKKQKKVLIITGVVLLLIVLAGFDLYRMKPIAIDRTGKRVPTPTVTFKKAYVEGLRRIYQENNISPDYVQYDKDETGNYSVPSWNYYPESIQFKEGVNPIRIHTTHIAYYVDKEGNTQFKVSPAHWADIFSEGLAAIATERTEESYGGFIPKRWGFVDKTGAWVIPPQFDQASSFSEGLAAVTIDGKAGFIDKEGKFVLPAQYFYAASFSEGLAAVSPLEGKDKEAGMSALAKGYIDHSGQWIIKPQFIIAGEFSEGLAPVCLDINSDTGHKSGYIDKTGKMVIPPGFQQAQRFSEGLAAVDIGEYPYDRWGYIDTTGAFIVQPEYAFAQEYRDGVAVVFHRSKIEAFIAWITIKYEEYSIPRELESEDPPPLVSS